jgi:hypothetical protein
MEKQDATVNQNPLHKYFRQPKLYVSLPSNGRFYPQGALETTENGEYPVYSMTARDELTFKTPDALLNGQATVDVIQSCFPNIKDAWAMPSIDMDALMIALRIATYGENLELEVKVPGTDIEKTFSLDLRILLEQVSRHTYVDSINYQGMKINIRPLTYREFTKTALKTFEEQRILTLVNDEKMDEGEKLQRFATSFKKLTDITVTTVTQGIASIEVDGETISNQNFLQEFVANADKDLYGAIMDHLEAQRDQHTIKPMKVTTTEEEREAGAPDEYEVPISFDASNFFGAKS